MKRQEGKYFQTKLEMQGGCRGCMQSQCRNNGPVATKELAEMSEGELFLCNRQKEKQSEMSTAE